MFYVHHCIYPSLYGTAENFMEGDSMSESQSLTNSLPRDLEKSTSSGKAVRLGVAFDPSAGPGDVESSKVV